MLAFFLFRFTRLSLHLTEKINERMRREGFEDRVAVEKNIAAGTAGHIAVAGEELHMATAAVEVLHTGVAQAVLQGTVAAEDILHTVAVVEVLRTAAVVSVFPVDVEEVEELGCRPVVLVVAGHRETADKEIDEDPGLGLGMEDLGKVARVTWSIQGEGTVVDIVAGGMTWDRVVEPKVAAGQGIVGYTDS